MKTSTESEHSLQNQIRVQTALDCILFRTNAGSFWQGTPVYSKEFKQTVLVNLRKIEGLPEGYSDLSGVRKSDGKAVFIEVKQKNGKIRKAQENFINQMKLNNAIAGICRSADEAVELIRKDK